MGINGAEAVRAILSVAASSFHTVNQDIPPQQV